jgi:hypothetical protein
MRKVKLNIIKSTNAIIDDNELKCSSECFHLHKPYARPVVCELRVSISEPIKDGYRTKFCLESEAQ